MQSQNLKFKIEFKIRNQNEKFKICPHATTHFEFKFVISDAKNLHIFLYKIFHYKF